MFMQTLESAVSLTFGAVFGNMQSTIRECWFKYNESGTSLVALASLENMITFSFNASCFLDYEQRSSFDR